MLIANPIYDVFFKYLLEDNEIAKDFIGAIIDEEILELTLKPQETAVQMKEFAFTVLRMDFHAVIQTKEGKKSVIIEMQKGKYFEDLQRFRKYLGEMYIKDPLPIIAIYFLGYPLDSRLPSVTVVKHNFYDRITNQKVEVKNSFLESLNHQSYVIQIPLLKPSVKTKIETLLTIFDQARRTAQNYILSFPEELAQIDTIKKIVRRLQLAGVSEEMRKKAEIEDEVERSFKSMAREIQEKEELIEQKEQVIQEKEQVIQEKEQVIQEKEQVIQEKEKLLKEQERIIQELQKRLSS